MDFFYFWRKLIILAIITLATGTVIAQEGKTVEIWHGFNISGEGDYGTPGYPVGILYESHRDITGTYNDVLKLEPPSGGYRPGSIGMSYTVPRDGNYRLSMWVWAERSPFQEVFVEFEHIGGNWETIAGSRDETAAFREGEWLYVATDSRKYPNGIFLSEGEKFGLLTQNNQGIGLGGCTIFLRDVVLEEVAELAGNYGRTVEEWHGFNVSGEGDYGNPGYPAGTLYDTYRDITGTYTDVLKLEPPPDGYKPGSIGMSYTVPSEGNYRLSVWVWADTSPGQEVFVEFEQIGGNWETIAGSVDEQADFRGGEWLFITTNPKKYPNGIFLSEGGKFGLLTRNNRGIGLDDCTIYLRELILEEVTEFSEENDESGAKWHGFNISGIGDYGTPGNPIATLYETYTDSTGTYADVLKLEPPPGGYEPGSIAMTYTVPKNGDYRLSMWVWAEKAQDQNVYIEFEHIGGNWETIAGSRDDPAAFRDGEWLYVSTNSRKYPNGIYLDEGDKFGLLTQGNDGIGLNGCTIYIRDAKLEPVKPSILKGLFFGLEFCMDNIFRANDDEMECHFYTTIGYDKSLFNGSMYFYSELGLKTGLYEVEKEDGESTYPVKMYLDSYLDYSFYFKYSTLTFMIEEKIEPLAINPRYDTRYRSMYNRFTPGMRFNQWVDNIGSIYSQVGFPIHYTKYWDNNTDLSINFQGMLGWRSQFGLGLWIREECLLSGGEWAEPGHQSISFALTYWTRPFNTSLEVSIPKRYGKLFFTSESNVGPFFSLKIEAGFPQEDFKSKGVDLTITPKIRYLISNRLSIWANCVIWDGGKMYDVVFAPAIGFFYYF